MQDAASPAVTKAERDPDSAIAIPIATAGNHLRITPWRRTSMARCKAMATPSPRTAPYSIGWIAVAEARE